MEGWLNKAQSSFYAWVTKSSRGFEERKPEISSTERGYNTPGQM